MKRRDFVKTSALASTALMIPSFLEGYGYRPMAADRAGKILVVIQLSGGNDGLNTVVPYQSDIYYRSRPDLAVSRREVLPLNDAMGLNAAMEPLREIYDQGWFSILNSVGYPNPDRSHFRSTDIWHTASDSQEYWQSGWIGRYLDSYCPNPYYALNVGDELSMALKGEQNKGFVMKNPEILQKTTGNRFLSELGRRYEQGNHHETAAYLYKTLIETQQSAAYLVRQSKVYRSMVDYPDTRFAQELKLVAQLISADTDTGIYYLNLSGFDTHARQQGQHERLLGQYAEGIAAFMKDLRKNDLLKDTLIMTFSEFGRRVEQNGSMGTDHGTANNLFLMGGSLARPGIYNEAPDLADLENGDLKYRVDFRQVYATILEKWLDESPDSVLGRSFKPLHLL
ncbi:MAG: DUF1501 domain-containing protein [Saprospiraceae bacterium]|nr:DUF1501 domain-containing protein [Saprospiraceae bacterium]